ncbi:MAG: thioredoxin family protein [Thermoplasmatota archaeon]
MALYESDPSPETLERLVAENDVVFVDFYATWCAPCRAYSPKFSRAARELRRAEPDARFVFVSVDIDRNIALARAHHVQSVPTTVALAKRRGWFGRMRRVERVRFSGDRPWNELMRELRSALSES